MPTADAAEIRLVLRQALAEVLDQDVPELTEETRLFADLGIDSSDVIELLMTLEQSTGLKVDPDQLAAGAFETVATLTGYIAACLAAAQEPVG
jgi:acyl carrier protein